MLTRWRRPVDLPPAASTHPDSMSTSFSVQAPVRVQTNQTSREESKMAGRDAKRARVEAGPRTVKLGRSDISVTEVCLGTMTFGSMSDEKVSGTTRHSHAQVPCIGTLREGVWAGGCGCRRSWATACSVSGGVPGRSRDGPRQRRLNVVTDGGSGGRLCVAFCPGHPVCCHPLGRPTSTPSKASVGHHRQRLPTTGGQVGQPKDWRRRVAAGNCLARVRPQKGCGARLSPFRSAAATARRRPRSRSWTGTSSSAGTLSTPRRCTPSPPGR